MAEERRRIRQMEDRIFVDGNTVRREAEYEVRTDRDRQQISRQVWKNRQKARSMTVGYVSLLIFASLVTASICIATLLLQSRIVTIKREIHNMQTEIDDLRLENNAMADSMTLSTDLDYVYKVATKKLGMVYPTEDQVIRFDKTESEYVRQYEDIPITD